MSKKLIIYILLSIFLIIVIFSFSNENAIKSNDTSKNLIKYFTQTYEKTFNKNLNEKIIVNNLNYPVRKLAHYSLYFLLGILVCSIFSLIKIEYKAIISIIICIVFAIIDETHQLFILGRTAKIFDVLVDTLGSITGITLIKIIKGKSLKKKIS